jgi:single-stranded DNA-binding protein
MKWIANSQETRLPREQNIMIDALISGKLIKDPSLRTGQSGNHFAQFLLSVHTGEEQPIVVSGIAFGAVAEKIVLLKKGDPLSVIGSLKPTEWIDKTTNETRHGLSVTVNNSLSPYDIKKRKLTPTASSNSVNEPDFDDDLTF